MRLTTKFIICIVLINQVACNLVDKGTLEKVEYLRNLKQTWEDNKDQFPEIQTQLSQAQIVWGVPLQAYDPSIKSSGHEMVLVTTKDSQAISHTNDSTGIYKAIFKSRGFLHQKVEQGAFVSIRGSTYCLKNIVTLAL